MTSSVLSHRYTLVMPIIVVAQFFCTSLWFAGNVIIPDLVHEGLVSGDDLGHMSSAVQLGFIVGTLCYAILSISDRYSPSKVFFLSAVAASFANIGMVYNTYGITLFLTFRFFTGFFLAGIYPVGMKIAADYYEKGLGKALGFLVGALVFGTAFPHLLRSLSTSLPYKLILFFTSGLSILGGVMILLLVPNGPFQKFNKKFDLSAIFKIFEIKELRKASVGYFGHMWELYTFWTFIPVIFAIYLRSHPNVEINTSILAFIIIAGGSVSCMASGFISQKIGTKKTAFIFLLLSCICCLISPLTFYLPVILFLVFLILWGLVVVADSPMFSTLVAQHAPIELKGSALTIITCIGFSITILSIEMIGSLAKVFPEKYIYLLLAIGPIIGLKQMVK